MIDFTQESIRKAIETIDQNPELRKDRQSVKYDLVFDGKDYPPILVLSEASKILGGGEVFLSDFGNSVKEPFDILRGFGYVINERKGQFYEQLMKFIEQAQRNDLRTSHYLDNFLGLKVRVSFGQGSPARVPWIAFLGGNNTVSQGIYPVYLFFKSKNLLVLAYGVSETNMPQTNWRISDGTKVSAFFIKNNLGSPERYGDSYVFATYDTTKPLNVDEVNQDINGLIEIYKNTLQQQPNTNQAKTSIINNIPKVNSTHSTISLFNNSNFDYHSFDDAVMEAGLFINKHITLRFIASLLTKPFVILTGLSGSGKTKLAQAFSKWITEDDSQVCIVPVGADWTNREPLLGYPNALESGKYISPDSGVLELLLEANKSQNTNKPYFLILDEMNLSHVERYFADFLSAMESSEAIPLHNHTSEWKDNIPAKIKLPPNLFLIGTVNIDETTYMFSPKVLDRANVIEFRITENEIKTFLTESRQVNLDLLRSKGVDSSKYFVELATNKSNRPSEPDELNKYLLSFFKELKSLGAEFGYRTASEIIRFAAIVNQVEPNWTIHEITDAAIMQKLLPKVHGSRRKLEPVLKALGALCLQDGQSIEEVINQNTVGTMDYSQCKFPISIEKISRMYTGLINNGFTSYAEA